MNKLFEKFLLICLWFITSILFTSFWFNYKFGFNFLALSHWKYLRDMQISSVRINPFFYTSVVFISIISLFTLYLIIRPKFKKINFQSIKKIENKVLKAEIINDHNSKSKEDFNEFKRPPRLNIPNIETSFKSKPFTKPINYDYKNELENIFKKAGFITKKIPYNLQISLIAIGANESMWIGCTNTTENIKNIKNKFLDVFSETLDDINIKMNLFIINSNDTKVDEDILKFNSISEVENFMKNNRSIITDDEKEDFDAYSEYVDVVIEYLSRTK